VPGSYGKVATSPDAYLRELENSDEIKDADNGQSLLVSDLDHNWWEVACRA
jgi:hypothetical protein